MNRICLKSNEGPEARGQGLGEKIANCKLQIANCKLPEQGRGARGEGLEARGQGSGYRVQELMASNHPIIQSSNHLIPNPQSLIPSTHSSFIIHHSSLRAPSSFILHPSSFRRSAFTLVELLVTITIIGILSAMSLGAMHHLRNVAAEDKTKATIAKINAIVMQQYESYMTRRVFLTDNFSSPKIPVDFSKISSKDAARIRLHAIRDLMRMEMPDRWSDVYSDPVSFTMKIPKKDGTTYDDVSIPEPTIKLAYKERWSQAKSALVNKGMSIPDAEQKVKDNGGPECLYLIVSMLHPEAMERFNQNEIGDVDGDGCPEFIDGWGNPISFLRWAPGFNQSEVQANIDTVWYKPPALQQRLDATTTDHDPFDPRKIDLEQPQDAADLFIPTPASPKVPTGWRLVPLIYSFGPDKKEGLYAAEDYDYKGNPYESIKPSATSTDFVGIGTPKDTNECRDNITNHRIEQQ